MKYTNHITIDLPREQVMEKFDNTENLKHWQPGLLATEFISGDPGQEGAKMRMEYQMGKRTVEMIETITKRNLPDEFHGTYEAKGVWNEMKNYFEDQGNKTLWRTETDFRFGGFMKIIAFLMPGSFKKQTQQYLDHFKAFAEEGKSVLNES